jgi:hypothetical protein
LRKVSPATQAAATRALCLAHMRQMLAQAELVATALLDDTASASEALDLLARLAAIGEEVDSIHAGRLSNPSPQAAPNWSDPSAWIG